MEEKEPCPCAGKEYNELTTCPNCQEHYHNDNLYCGKTGERVD